MNKVGYVVGESNTQEVTFVTDTERTPARLEYLVLKNLEEQREGETQFVDVLAQVTSIRTISEILSDDLSMKELESIKERYETTPRIYGKAKIIGYLTEKAGRKVIAKSRTAALPGHEVHIASDELLKKFFTRDIQAGLDIGSLINRSSVSVKLDPNGLRRHLAIIAQTGAGKSYLAGLIIEQLLKLGGTILIIDPNSDYVRMRYQQTEDEAAPPEETTFADRIQIYRPPGVEGRRFDDQEIGGSKKFTIHFSNLHNSDIFNFTGVPSNATRIQQAIRVARERFGEDDEYGPEELLAKLERMAESDKSKDTIGNASGAQEYIRSATDLDIWGYKDLPLDDIMEPMQVSVVDLAGIPSFLSEFIVDKTLNEIWRKASTGNLPHPIFVLLEEAHNFVPGKSSAYSKRTVNKIASEGRKFGMFLITVTQRPSKIDEETLSQCNSQIVMRLTNPQDQAAVAVASESMTERLLQDLPGLNIGEAVVTGPLTRTPVMVNISGRESAEGGSDIDLVSRLRAAKKEAQAKQVSDFDFPTDTPTEAEY